MKKLFVFASLLTLILVSCASPSVEVIDTPKEKDSWVEEPFIEVPTAIPPTTAPTPTLKPPTATSVPPPEPTIDDFLIELIVMEKQCFGSAGCLITVRPELTFINLESLPSGKSYTLIYEIYGGEDGTLTFNLTIEGDHYRFNEETISTANLNDELTVEAVRLIED
jgi:hypothetical protein